MLKLNSFQINEAVSFLHNLGSLQHFANDALKSKVVINPQWIVDVMACVVSVRSNAIEVKKVLLYLMNYPHLLSNNGLLFWNIVAQLTGW